MNITSAKYYTHPSVEGNQGIEIVSDGITMCIPINPDNTDFQAIQAWVAEGNTIEEAD